MIVYVTIYVSIYDYIMCVIVYDYIHILYIYNLYDLCLNFAKLSQDKDPFLVLLTLPSQRSQVLQPHC